MGYVTLGNGQILRNTFHYTHQRVTVLGFVDISSQRAQSVTTPKLSLLWHFFCNHINYIKQLLNALLKKKNTQPHRYIKPRTISSTQASDILD